MKFILTCILLLLISCSHSAKQMNVLCHPQIDESLSQYIIGYGSLIQTQSKQKTYPEAGENFPVWVQGFERNWGVKGLKIKTMYLGVTRNPSSGFNGVVFKLNHSNSIQSYDRRENRYCRFQVHQNDLTMLVRSSLPEGQFWIYIPKKEAHSKPSPEFPITQSYVDLFLSGCIEIESRYHIQNYAFHCIDTTSGWSKHWINDREVNSDRSPKKKPSPEEIKIINFLLETNLSFIFNSI